MQTDDGLVALDEELCTGCGECLGACPFDAISLRDGVAAVDPAACMGCGVCVARCSQGALALARDPSKSAPLEIRKMVSADV